MNRTTALLADGRELLLYDDVDRGRVAPVDRRLLEPSSLLSEVRTDPLSGDAVAMASHRQSRTFLPSTVDCPLCPGAGEIPADRYDVAVFENRWPSFRGQGRCEVMAFTDRHDRSLASLDPLRVRTIIDAWADRSLSLSMDPSVAYVACFENRGEAIGVTLHHPHGQVYGYPFVPPTIQQLIGKPFARVLAQELASTRVLHADDWWVAYVPFAARWPFEVIVMPRRHVAHLEDLDETERASLSLLVPRVLTAFDALFQTEVPYIAGWRQSPVGDDSVRAHWRVFTSQRDVGKLKHLAGSESAYGAFINDVLPEDAAARLRAALPA